MAQLLFALCQPFQVAVAQVIRLEGFVAQATAHAFENCAPCERKGFL